MGPPQDVVRQLLASLEKKRADEPLNVGSIEALGRLGPKAAEALATLRKHLTSTHPQIQRTGYLAVGQIVNAPAPSMADLKALEVVDWQGEDARYATYRALQQLGEKG